VSPAACTYDIALNGQCHKYYGVTYGKSVSKTAASLRRAPSVFQQEKTGLSRNSADRFVFCEKSIFPRKHIIIAKVERLGNPHKVRKIKSRNLVLT